YTLAVSNRHSSYTLSFLPLLSDSTCSVADPSFAAKTLTGSIAAGAAGACFTLAMKSGDVFHANIESNPFEDLLVTVFDSTGARICFDDAGDCTLTGTGPYLVFVNTQQGEASSYALQFNDLTQPKGCLAASQLTYGTAPDVTSTDRCRTLTVSVAGQYQVVAVSPDQGVGLAGSLYHLDGTVACTNFGSTCDLAVGSYNFVIDPAPAFPAHIGIVFIAANEGRGCEATGDTDFASGPAIGAFSGLGEEICLTLPTAASKTDYLFDQPTANGSAPQLHVFDATGVQMCQNSGSVETVCALTGVAPFHVVLADQRANGGYRILTQRTDSTAGCRVWPRSGFGGSWGATATLTDSADVACLSIAAKQHSTGEMTDYSNVANVVDAGLSVNDPTGTTVCTGASSAVCSYKPTVTYTALLLLTSGVRDTFHLVRRDVSSTALCSKPASTVPGVPAATLLLNSDLAARCFRVTAKATDDLAIDVRASAPSPAGAIAEVTNNSGTVICRQFGVNCTVTGFTSYQVLVLADNYQGVGITAHLDTWRVGTKAGWAPQCQAHRVSGATGWAPVRVSLSEATPVYCLVVAVQPSQQFFLFSTLNLGTVGSPVIVGHSRADWTSELGLCNLGGISGVGCQTQPTDKAGDDVLLVYPGQQPLPFSALFQGVCTMTCSMTIPPALVTSVNPHTGPADSLNTIVVRGTHLNLGTAIELARNGSPADINITPVSLNSRDTSMTMRVDTQDVAPGLYDVAMDDVGYTVGVPSPGYLPDAYRVTAGPPLPPSGSFVPDGPVRVADTRTGLGVPKAPLAAHQIARLKVAGVAGVPRTGVAAVVVSITVRHPVRSGSLTVYRDGTSRPRVTDISFAAGQTISDQVVVSARHGRIDVYNGSAGRLDLTADLSGYYATAGQHSLLTLAGPSRILDTRGGARRQVRIKVDGVAGVPRSGVSAVAVNLTVHTPAKPGYLAAFADGRPRPLVSQITFGPRLTISDLVSVPVRNGRIDLYNGSAGPVHVTADLIGYFSAAGARFRVAGPVRVLDTRTSFGGAGGALLPRGAAEFSTSNLPDPPRIVTMAVLSVTVIGGRAGGSLTVFADDQALPRDPTIEFGARGTVTSQVIVPVTGGPIDFYNNSTDAVQVIADVQGYYYVNSSG
ncbi:MAG TPA: hypothetical protein VN695_19280, partial [Streptosporangiaceae bacterium]|nr:hypothetical protein [Streptosporangiaceae bacterium]